MSIRGRLVITGCLTLAGVLLWLLGGQSRGIEGSGLDPIPAAQGRSDAGSTHADPRLERTIEVVSTAGPTVPEAALYFLSEHTSPQRRQANVEGEWSGPVVQAPHLRVRVEAPGHATAWALLAPEEGARTRIELGPEATIRGRVRWKGGWRLRRPARVVFIKNGDVPLNEALERGLLESDRARLEGCSESIRIVETTADGKFEVRGLPRDTDWYLGAIAEEGVHIGRRPRVRAGAEDIDLTLEPVHCAVLRLRDQRGGPPKAHPRVQKPTGLPSFEEVGPDLFASLVLATELRCAGPATLIGFESRLLDTTTRFVVLASPTAGPAELQVTHTVSVPGYEEVELELTPQPLGDATPEYAVELVPLVRNGGLTDWGALDLTCPVPCAPRAKTLYDDSGKDWLGNLYMTNLLTREVYRLPIYRPRLGVERLEGIPLGPYDCRLALAGRSGEQREFALDLGEVTGALIVGCDAGGALTLRPEIPVQ